MYIQILYTTTVLERMVVPVCFLEIERFKLGNKYSDFFFSKEQAMIYIIGTLQRNGLIEFSEVQDLCTRLIERKNGLPICLEKIGESNAAFLKRSLKIMDQLYEIKNFKTSLVKKKSTEEVFYFYLFIQVPETLTVPCYNLLSKN